MADLVGQHGLYFIGGKCLQQRRRDKDIPVFFLYTHYPCRQHFSFIQGPEHDVGVFEILLPAEFFHMGPGRACRQGLAIPESLYERRENGGQKNEEKQKEDVLSQLRGGKHS